MSISLVSPVVVAAAVEQDTSGTNYSDDNDFASTHERKAAELKAEPAASAPPVQSQTKAVPAMSFGKPFPSNPAAVNESRYSDADISQHTEHYSDASMTTPRGKQSSSDGGRRTASTVTTIRRHPHNAIDERDVRYADRRDRVSPDDVNAACGA